MEEGPKSFWVERERLEPSAQWVTHHDDHPTFATDAELIHVCAVRGLPLPMIEEMELWEIAASLGLHRVETLEQRDTREIVETKQEYWEETSQVRMEKLAKVAAERKERATKRAQERGRKRNEVVGSAN